MVIWGFVSRVEGLGGFLGKGLGSRLLSGGLYR